MLKQSLFKMLAFSGALIVSSFSFAGDFDVEAKYNQTCKACHLSGVAGAPKTGDKATWDKKMSAAGGLDGLVAAVKNGKGAMPPKGLCGECSDENFKALINHMIGK